LTPGTEFGEQLPHDVHQGQRCVYLRLSDFLISCVTQLTSRKAATYSFVFSSNQVLCSRIVRFIVTGHDGILPVHGDLPAPIVPHNGEIQQPTPAPLDRGQAAPSKYIQVVAYVSAPVACPTEQSGAVPGAYSRIALDGT
jgi:hypothetical protein